MSGIDSDIWLYDVLRGVKTRLTSGPGTARTPCWSPDGKHIVSAQTGKGTLASNEKAIDGAGDEELVLEAETAKYCESWSPDGKFLLYRTVPGDNSARRELWTLPLFGDRKPVPYLQTKFDEHWASFRLMRKWIYVYHPMSQKHRT